MPVVLREEEAAEIPRGDGAALPLAAEGEEETRSPIAEEGAHLGHIERDSRIFHVDGQLLSAFSIGRGLDFCILQCKEFPLMIRIRKKGPPPSHPHRTGFCSYRAVAMEAVPWAHSSSCSFFPSLKSPFVPPRRTPPLLASGRRRRRRPRLEVIGGEKVEIRVCVNRSCNRMGSREILAVLSDISPPEVSVNSCGCLGRCGAGPNLVVLPEGTLVGHCATAARAAELLARVCGGAGGGGEGSFDPWRNLEALALRKKGEVELVERGNPAEADALLSQAIDLKPSGGLHIIYKSRSVARLKLGNSVSALEDAKEALKIAPNFPQSM